MRFAWTEEQEIMRSSVSSYLQDRYQFDERQNRLDGKLTDATWKDFAELGLLGLPFEEEYGGLGGTALDTLLIMESFGRWLVIDPYLPNVVLAGSLLRNAATANQKASMIPPLIAGQTRYAVGYAEPQSRFNLANVATEAKKTGDSFTLNGRKAVVLGAPESDTLLITARTSGDSTAVDGISLFALPVNTPGIKMRPYRNVDGHSAAELWFENVKASPDALIGEEGGIFPYLESAVDEAVSAACGEAVGMMRALNDKSIEYGKTREAFGQPIAKFQVIQHRLVDMEVAYEQASALAIKAAVKLTENAPDKVRTVSACKVKIDDEAGFVAKQAVQLHGAIGITEELDIGHYLKRVMNIKSLFGNADHHLRRYSELDKSTKTPESV